MRTLDTCSTVDLEIRALPYLELRSRLLFHNMHVHGRSVPQKTVHGGEK